MAQKRHEYLTYFEDGGSGLLEMTSDTKQFIVTAGSTVNFRVRMGSKFAQNPVLLVNLPQEVSSRIVQEEAEESKDVIATPAPIFTEAPLSGGSGETLTDGKALTTHLVGVQDKLLQAEPSRKVVSIGGKQYTMTQPINEDGTRLKMGEGWALSTTHLRRILPKSLLNSQQRPQAQTYFEFTVEFVDSGSFFVQLEYGPRSSSSPIMTKPAALTSGAAGAEINNSVRCSKPSYINVEPLLRLSKDSPLAVSKCKELSICTVVSRCLGPTERWSSVLEPLAEQGFNAVHFTPIQKYGQSFSHYSIANQTEIDDYFSEESNSATPTQNSDSSPLLAESPSDQHSMRSPQLSKKDKFQRVQQAMASVRGELGMLGLVDIVLNHTANNSDWIQEHPEACYNTDEVPRLWPAYLLDQTLVQMSNEFSKGGVSWCPSAPYLNNESDLRQVIAEMKRRARSLNLHEFFVGEFDRNSFLQALPGLSQAEVMAKVEEFTRQKLFAKDPFEVLQKHFLDNLAHGPDRRQVRLRQPDAAIFFTHLNNQNVSRAIEQVEGLIRRSNEYWTTTVTMWIDEAIENSTGTMRYFKLKLKRHLISKKNYLLDPYFSVLNNEAQSKVVHNGWIADHNPLVDFAEEQDFPYLRRQVNIWGDSIKLRYGTCPADSPYLWAHMSEYVTQMATLFDGFRLDNAHSTPIHVCQYMLQVARSQNPNLLIMAELFTSSAQLDNLFTTRLNINGMIREIMNKGDVGSVGAYFHEITCREAVLGRLDQEYEHVHLENSAEEDAQMYRLLIPTKPSDVIYDCTHDNPSPLEKFGTRRLTLPTLGLLGLADQIIATTWGYDQLLPENISVVKEERLYPVEDSLRDAWGSQDSSHLPVQPIEYVFRYSGSHGCQSVTVAGEFNSWSSSSLAMSRIPHSNDWQVSYPVHENYQGRRVQFKFVENGGQSWMVNHNLPKVQDNGGNENNYFCLGDSRNSFDTQHQVQKMKNVRVARMLLNRAHKECTQNDAEIFMHSQTEDTIVVVRQLPLDHSESYDAYVTIQRFPFADCNEASISTSVELPGFLSEVIFAANLVDGYKLPPKATVTATATMGYSQERLITSPAADVYMHNSLQPFAKVIDGAHGSRLEFMNLPQAFTCLIKTRCSPHIKQAVRDLDKFWMSSCSSLVTQLSPSSSKLSLTDLNHLLFRCSNEEKDISGGQRGSYGLPDRGQFVYSGLQSLMHLFQKLKVSGDMGDSLLENIRQGDWLMEYSQERIASYLVKMPKLQHVNETMAQMFSLVKKLPASFKPKYVCRVVEKLFNVALHQLINCQMSAQIAFHGTPDPFLQQMTLASAQMWAKVPSMQFQDFNSSMCAGLPHFSTGYMRCWGRDTFISLRGLFLTTGLFKQAKDTILFFAKVERHGLIPNLHDQGNNTRFNARDATWFFLQSIKDYIEMADDGLSILEQTFEAVFESRWVMTIQELVIKILQAHASGINFREYNAGSRIDDQMKDNGFNIKIEADLGHTGFCFGGNNDNCGTWMDKMGSVPMVNKGVPATPRDGAPIELVGLQYSILSFLAKLNDEGKFPHAGVDQITFKEWAAQIKANFNRCFYVPLAETNGLSSTASAGTTATQYDLDARYIHRRGIYKDTYRSTQGSTDYQLRPNLCIAMAVAPELFEADQARKCLEIVEEVLMTPGAMGIKTLDPADPAYDGDYDNDDESRGHNYHQGPEWVWPVGYFLISKLHFGGYASQKEAARDIFRHLLPHQEHMLTKDPWHSLPELTNSGGKPCEHSCPAQAWSIATLLDALQQLGTFKPIVAAQSIAI